MRFETSPLAEDEAHSLTNQIRASRGGRVPLLFRFLLHSTELAEGWLALGTAVRHRMAIPDDVRELSVCLIARLNEASYEWQQHSPLALEAGITQEQLECLPAWRDESSFTDEQRAVLGFVENMTKREVTDDDVTSLRKHLSDQQVIELAGTVCYYISISHFLQAFEIEAGNF